MRTQFDLLFEAVDKKLQLEKTEMEKELAAVNADITQQLHLTFFAPDAFGLVVHVVLPSPRLS